MRRLLLTLALLLVAPFSAEAATCTVSTSGTWTAIGTGTAVFSCGTPTTADTIVIPATFTLTIPAGSTVDFSTAAGAITNNGTLVVNGTLKMYNDADGTGTWTVTGTLKSCASGSGSCTIAGQTASNIYALNTLSDGRYISGGWRMTYTTDAWDGGMAVGDILEYTDIDGDPDNDSPAGALRPFFHIATVTAGSDLIETTYGVGSSVSDYTLAYNEGNTSVACYVGDTAGGGAGVASIDIADSDADSVELDQAWSSAIGVTDRSTTISLPTGTLSNNQDHDFEGQWICLAAAGTDAYCYMIWDSVDGAGGRDLVRVWPPIKSNDYTAAAKTCTIGWGEPTATVSEPKGLQLGEFIVFTPARVMGNRPGVSVNMTTTGQFNTTFANIGPAAGAAGYGVAINYGADSVVAATERHTWHTGLSGNSAIGSADGSHIGMTAGSSGTLTLSNVRFTHDFEPRDASSVSGGDTVDKTSGVHGVSNVGSATLIAGNFGCFKIGDACVAITSSSPTVDTFNKITCGWIDGKSSACVKATTTTHDVTINGLYSANTNSKGRVCDGAGASPTTAGTRCSVAGDCTGVGDTCVDATGSVVDISGGATADVIGLVVLAGDNDGYHATDVETAGTTGSTGVTVNGGFILDNRTDNANAARDMSMFAGINSVRHVSMPFAVQLVSNLVSTYSNNYAMRVRAKAPAGIASVLGLFGDLGAGGAPTFRIENNVILDLYDTTADDLIDFYDTTIPAGAKLYFNNNKIDRSRLASTTRLITIASNGTDFGVTADGELIQMRNNAVSGYGEMLNCTNPTWPASTADLEVSGNAFAPSSGITLGQDTFVTYGCTQANSRSNPINKANDIVNRYRLLGGPVGGYSGPNGVAGYRQTDFLTSLGIESVWVESGGSGGGGDAPCLGSACGIPNIGSR